MTLTEFLLSIVSVFSAGTVATNVLAIIRQFKSKRLLDTEIAKEPESASIDDTNKYMAILEKMIDIQASYGFSVMLAKNDILGIKDDVENETILNTSMEIAATVLKDMSTKMRDIIYNTYGEAWIDKYIKLRVEIAMLNYVKAEFSKIK